ncbi:sigma-54-dependent transcriptional regulator [Candidatus Rariloculus sp.]|uniref:sigma-54-dependent transcriptional regulator n=1 Tax=Candidatus Rariloculus sp. TaxID=3101265 RepID=UPI003D139E57
MNDARILVVDDESNIRELLEEILSEEGYDVTTAADAEHARAARNEQNYDLTLLDIWMPDTDGISLLEEWAEGGSLGPVVMMSGHGTVDTAVEATRLGALDFIEKPISLTKLLRTVEKALAWRRSKELRRSLVGPLRVPMGKSAPIAELRDLIKKIARHDTTVLFTGESGSGRERFARYLASRATRSHGPFVTVIGAGLGEDDCRRLLLGEGDKTGVLERARGGVLYIRGIDDVSPTAQLLLLGILERGSYRPAGAVADQPLDVRILAGAPPGFERDETFSEELLALLNAVVVRVPPLREHSEDVPELLRYHADVLVDAENVPFRRFSVAAQNRLRNYPWPGNVRELRNLVKRLLILGGSEEISLKEIEAQLQSETAGDEPLVKQDLLAMPLREARKRFERAYLRQQLILCDGKVGKLAKRVGMERTHLYRMLRSLGIDFRRALDNE